MLPISRKADVANKPGKGDDANKANKAVVADEIDEAIVTDEAADATKASEADLVNKADLANKATDTVEAVGAGAANGINLTSGCCKITRAISHWSCWGWRGNEAKADDADEANSPNKDAFYEVVEAKGHD